MTREEEIQTKAEELYGKVNKLFPINEFVNEEKRNCFVAGAKWADETIIEKAVNWLRSHVNDFMPASYSIQKYNTNGLLYYFKESMKGGKE